MHAALQNASTTDLRPQNLNLQILGLPPHDPSTPSTPSAPSTTSTLCTLTPLTPRKVRVPQQFDSQWWLLAVGLTCFNGEQKSTTTHACRSFWSAVATKVHEAEHGFPPPPPPAPPPSPRYVFRVCSLGLYVWGCGSLPPSPAPPPPQKKKKQNNTKLKNMTPSVFTAWAVRSC